MKTRTETEAKKIKRLLKAGKDLEKSTKIQETKAMKQKVNNGKVNK